MKPSPNCLTWLCLVALLPSCGLVMLFEDCGDPVCTPAILVPGEYTGASATSVVPHANATNRTATISQDTKTLTICYQRDGKEVIETWAIGP